MRITLERRQARRVAVAALVGTAVEWYDFFLFGAASSLVFSHVFFATDNALLSLAFSMSTFAVGLVARPFGGLVLGSLGDRVGRRPVLLGTIVGIGVVTALIGLLPGTATIGVWAPVLLIALRLLQGVSAGGEWGGAMTLVIEHAPPEQRSRLAAAVQVGSPIGSVFASGAMTVTGWLFSEAGFLGVGWRVPFLLAVPLLLVAWWLRRSMDESPAFRALAETDRPSSPLATLAGRHRGAVLVATATAMLGVAGFFVVGTYLVGYGREALGLDRTTLLLATMLAAVVEIALLLVAGRVAERVGSMRVALVGALLTAALTVPMFALFASGSPLAAVVALVVLLNVLSIPYAVAGPLMTAQFPVEARFSGVTLAQNIAGALGGLAPAVAGFAVAGVGGHWWPAAALLVAMSLVTAWGAWRCGRRPDRLAEDAVR